MVRILFRSRATGPIETELRNSAGFLSEMPRRAPTSGIVTPYLRSRPFLDGLNLYEFFVRQEIVEDFPRPGEEEGHVYPGRPRKHEPRTEG
jgi:hypothetical protein